MTRDRTSVCRHLASLMLAFCLCLAAPTARATDGINVEHVSWQLFAAQGEAKQQAADTLAATRDKSLIPTFVLAMRWTGSNIHIARALSQLAGKDITHWHQAYDFQELNPDITPHKTFTAIKMRLLGNTDKRFLEFFKAPYGTPDKMKIRLEEITWGGVLVDGITSLDNPTMIPATKADYLLNDDLVFGIEINGDVRAYPLRIMGWHEMFNDTIGGVPVALAYCTLCGTGILFETQPAGRTKPLVFGSSGLLYRSNKLMFDRETKSLWNQFTGKPVIGPLADSDTRLTIRPSIITTWAEWKAQHPTTTVLSLDTGYHRNYGSGVTYSTYFASPDLMFPAVVRDETEVKRKDYVFGIETVGAAKAWPVEAFRKTSVINDRVGNQDVVLIGDPQTRTVRAYQRHAQETFRRDTANTLLSNNNTRWQLTENALVSEDGKQMRARVPGRLSYWFAWENYMGVKSELYRD